MSAKPVKPISTQSHLPFAAIEDGVVIMRDGSYRAVLTVGSTNFLLKSEAEQNALIVAYQGFLNSLNYSIQVVMQSRHLDLEPYLKNLESRTLEQSNELVRQQTTDYVSYVRELINLANIMDKHFYVIVPFTPMAAIKKGLFGLFSPHKDGGTVSVGEIEFNTHRDELMQRANIVANGLSSMGLKANVLDTDDIVKMLYMVYNYEIASSERLDKPGELAGRVISTKEEDDAILPPEPAPITTKNEAEPATPREPTTMPKRYPVPNQQIETAPVTVQAETMPVTMPAPVGSPAKVEAEPPKTIEVA